MLQGPELDKILQEAQQKNNAEAQFKLGMHFKAVNASRRQGSGYYNDNDAIKWITLAAKQNYPSAAKELLILILANPVDYRHRAEEVFEAASSCLNSKVVFADEVVKSLASHLTNIYYPQPKIKAYLVLEKIYKEKGNVKERIAALEASLQLGSIEALNILGDLYYNGEGIPQDRKRALQLFQSSCTNWRPAPNSYTFLSYGWMLHRGYGLAEPNLDKAIEYYQKSLPDQVAANFELGKIYYTKYCEKRNKNEQDYKYEEYKRNALRYLADSHPKAQGEAFNYIGIIYYNDNNFAEAVSNFLRAKEAGNVAGVFNLAQTYSAGRCGPQKQTLALQLYRDAANSGYPNAQYKMFELYSAGAEGCPHDNIKALLMLQKAAKQNHSEAVTVLADRTKIFAYMDEVYNYIIKHIVENEAQAIVELNNILRLEQKIQYQFVDVANVYKAFDRTIDKDTGEARYQLLESIGDGVLNATIRLILYSQLPVGCSTGRFTNMYEHLIRNATVLPEIAKTLGLAELIKKDVTEGDHVISAKMLADAMEALIGAIAIDSKGTDKAAKTINMLWEPYVKEVLNTPAAMAAAAVVEPPATPVAAAAGHASAASGHRRGLSAASIELQQKLTSYGIDELTAILQQKRERASIETKQGDSLLHLLARQAAQLATNPRKLEQCVAKLNTLILFGATIDTQNKQGQTARQLLSACPQIELQGNVVQPKF